MTERPWLRAVRRLAASALSAFCLWRGVDAALAYFGSEDAYSYLSDWRAAARDAPGARLALWCKDADAISPVERSHLVAMAWERAPEPLATVDAESDLRDIDCVLSSSWISRPSAERLRSCGFSVVSSNEYVKTWGRMDGVCQGDGDSAGDCRRRGFCGKGRTSPGIAREVVALSVELAIVVLAFSLAVGVRGAGSWPVASSLVVGVLLGVVALSHPLLAPNGLGVYGGKAKVLFECGGIPDAFLASAGGEVLQPTYPPGLAWLAWLHFALSGGCGDRLVQLLVVFAMAALCFAMQGSASSPRQVLSAALFCLSPVAVRMASGFYAEPFAALALVLGWRMAGGGQRIPGALVMGLAGLFRLEAGVAAAAFAACACWPGAGRRERLLALAAPVLPSVCWHVACKALGYGSLPDWDFGAVPKLGQVAYAAWVETKALWENVVPVAALAFLVRAARRPFLSPGDVRALVPSALLLALIPLACGFHSSHHAEWMADNTVPRLAWYVSAILVAEVAGSRLGR